MVANGLNILIVDDNRDNCDLLEDIFEEEFDVKCLFSGKECLDELRQKPDFYDILLLDVNMPKMDGYEVCRSLKSDSKTALLPIVFVSALASTEERLRGYEAGAEDYVTKPFKSEEIEETVSRVLEHHKITRDFEIQSKEAMSTAFQAMTNSSELGYIIQFLQKSFTCKSIDQLANALLETAQLFGLRCCLMVKSQYQTLFYGGEKGSIESKVCERFCEEDKIVNFGARTLVNEKRVSLLVKNMPVDNEEDYGRVKDNIVVLVGGTEARTAALEVEHQLIEERNRGIQAVLINSHEKLQEIHNLIEIQRTSTGELLETINRKIEEIIFGLGLDEDQEREIISVIDKGVDELGLLTQYSEKVETSFQGFIVDLDNLVGQ